MKLRAVIEALHAIAPKEYAFGFDNVGLQIGDLNAPLSKAVVALDRSLAALEFARQNGAQLLVSHHPLLFDPVKQIHSDDHQGRAILFAASNKIAVVTAHTNWDSAKGGINDVLAAKLGLGNVKEFGYFEPLESAKLVFTAPSSAVEKIVDRLAEAGAGTIGEYSRCAFMSEGTRTFHGSPDSNPAVGSAGKIESVPEVRVEMIVPAGKQESVRRALLAIHPYESPAYDFYTLRSNVGQPAGRIGEIEKTALSEFARRVDEALDIRCWTWGDLSREVRKVAVVGGAADGEWRSAQRAGADVFVTGEVKQHIALEACESGLAIIAAGHYATEHPGCVELAGRLSKSVREIDWLVFEPSPGLAGRPF